MSKTMQTNKRLKKNKKGVASTFQIAIISLIVIIVLSIFLYQAYTSLREKMAIKSCKTSISTHSLIAANSLNLMSTDIKCPTEEIKIKDLKKAKETIAEDMHRCGYIWNQGKEQHFKGEGTFCHICTIYQFGLKGREINGFMQYLSEKPITVRYVDDIAGLSYQDYFNGYTTARSTQMIGGSHTNTDVRDLSDLDTINTSQKYATIFVYSSGKESMSKILEGSRTAVETTGGIMFLSGMANRIEDNIGFTLSFGSTLKTPAVIADTTPWNPIGNILVEGAVLGDVAKDVGIYNSMFDTNDPQWISFLIFRPYDVEGLRALGCEKLEVNQLSNAGTP